MFFFLIDETTINATFDLSFGQKVYEPLTDAKMTKFRSELEELKFIILHEMSMVSSDLNSHGIFTAIIYSVQFC